MAAKAPRDGDCPGCARGGFLPFGGVLEEVFPGVWLAGADAFRAQAGRQSGREVLAVCCCFGGWLECAGAYVGPGEVAITATAGGLRAPENCRGAALLVEIPEGCEAIRRAASALGELAADPAALRERLKGAASIRMRDGARVQAVFEHMLTAFGPGFRRLKALELFALLLAPQGAGSAPCPSACRRQAETARRVHDLLSADLSQRVSVAEAARRLRLPMTGMKACFKRVYGLPVDTYMRRLRMDEAARLLRHTRFSVAEIADRVGYATPARFSASFRREMRLTPTAYRNLPDQNG